MPRKKPRSITREKQEQYPEYHLRLEREDLQRAHTGIAQFLAEHPEWLRQEQQMKLWRRMIVVCSERVNRLSRIVQERRAEQAAS